MIKLIVKDITDVWIRKAFQDVQNFLNTQALLLCGFTFLEINETSTTPQVEVPAKHNLGAIPKDVILTSSVGTGAITFHYDLFTKDNIIYSTTGPVTIRAFIGRFDKNLRF